MAETENLHPHPLKVFLQLLGWLAAGLSLFAAMFFLELHWNFVNWKPVADWIFFLLLLMTGATLAGFERLTRIPHRNPARPISLIICLSLLCLGIYLLPQEPLTEGLFARSIPSPAWYRCGRLLVMAAPTIIWLSCFGKRT